MNRLLTLGYSPCPNDTFIFHALVHGLVPTAGFTVQERLEDVETLNRLGLAGVLDLTKVSCHALGHLRQHYALLRSGGALGRGCGPLVIARQPTSMAALRGRRIAIPGTLTTANLLLQLFGAGYETAVAMPFDPIMPALLIIHESRFTYRELGLHRLVDLGEWWEGETGLPIPLGGIVARRSLGAETIAVIEQALHAGVAYARSHPAEARRYIREHAQEMSDEVCTAHIGLYVNDFSTELGEEGERAIDCLLKRAENSGIIPRSTISLFS